MHTQVKKIATAMKRTAGAEIEPGRDRKGFDTTQQVCTMKSAEAMLEELVSHVRPPRGCAIVLTEWKSSGPTEPNWVDSTGNMEAQKLARYNEKIAELRKTDPQIDWSDVKIHRGSHRVVLWLSTD
jgi:hypothetical protein